MVRMVVMIMVMMMIMIMTGGLMPLVKRLTYYNNTKNSGRVIQGSLPSLAVNADSGCRATWHSAKAAPARHVEIKPCGRAQRDALRVRGLRKLIDTAER